jgi:hypothetical protein
MKDTDPRYNLWLYFAEQHDLLLLYTELHDIKALVAKCVEDEKSGVSEIRQATKTEEMSVKATEVRIGNLVYYNGIEAFVTLPDIKAMLGVSAMLYKPIPLTDEWLVRFGATQESISLCFKGIKVGGSVLNINPDNGVCWVTMGINILNIPQLIQHVHQLQNLYFALTGEELTIKPTDR